MLAQGTYTKYIGKSGAIWLLRNGPNQSDGIYAEGDGEGFGGILITFTLDDGVLFDIKGPYHSNAHDFREDTGVIIT